MRAPAAVAGLLGGLCWLAAHVLGAETPLTWVGGALLALALLGVGAGVVSRSATWLRVVVAVCLLALAASVLEVLRDAGDPVVVDVALGVLAAAVSVVVLVRRPRGRADRRAAGRPAASHRARGSHAR